MVLSPFSLAVVEQFYGSAVHAFVITSCCIPSDVLEFAIRRMTPTTTLLVVAGGHDELYVGLILYGG